MDLTPLESPLREKVQAHLDRHPDSEEIVARLLTKRANTDPSQRDKFDKMFELLLTPSSKLGWIFGGMIVLLVAGLLGTLFWRQHQLTEAVENGQPMVAKVTRLEAGSCTLTQKGNKCVELALELHPEAGPAYAATLTHDLPLEWLSRVQPGSWLTVAVDRKDPHKVYFNEKSMSVEAPKPAP